MLNLTKVKEKINNTTASKHNPIYDTMMYWSQKAYNISDILIEEFTRAGDIIFDPFMGSGVTLIESVSDKNKRNAIGSEINDVPIFITKMALKRLDYSVIDRLNNLILELRERSRELYFVKCPACNSAGIMTSLVFDKNNGKHKIKNINYICSNSKCKCKNKTSDLADYDLMNRTYPIKNITDIELIYNSKIAVSENMHISSIFTNRNFKALDSILELRNTKYHDIASVIDYLLISMIHLCKITDTHSNSQWPLWTPKILSKFIEYKKKNYQLCYENTENMNNCKCSYKILNCGTQNIQTNDIPDNYVDLILTDPPYMGQVLYSEYMQLYKPFLGFNFNLEDEIIVSSAPAREKKEEEYFELLESAFLVCGKKLKENHFMAMYFHDCNLSVWNRLINILRNSGFEYISQIHIDKTITLKNIISPKKSLNGDSILFFMKINNKITYSPKQKWSNEIETNIFLEAKRMLSNGPLSTPELYDNGLMEIIIQNGWLEVLSKKYKSLVDIFEKYFVWDKTTARWKNKE